jgi:AraC-like DNA-binding protein
MNFLELFEPLPLPHLFFATLIWVALVGATVILIVRLGVRAIGIDPSQPILVRDAVIGSLSGMFALMVAFSASGIWNDALQARAAVQREANAIENVNALAVHYPAELREEVHDALLRYGRRVIESDWPAMKHRAGVNDTLFQRGNGPLIQLIDQIAEARSGSPDLPYSDLLISQLLDLRSARLQREVIARGGVSPAQWVALITIAMAAMLVIAVAHNHAFGLQTAAMGAYVLGVSAALFVVLAHDRPFVGHSGVQPLPIRQAIDRIENPPHP